MARDSQLGWLMSAPVLFFLILIGFVPIVFPIMSRYEGELLPVVKNVWVSEVEHTATGLVVDVTFDKVRACEFLGLSWYDVFGDRLPVLFEVESANLPSTRPVMDSQQAGPWQLIGIDNLDGSVAITSHRCHPLWITYTRFYP